MRDCTARTDVEGGTQKLPLVSVGFLRYGRRYSSWNCRRGVVRLVAKLLNFFGESGAVVAFGICRKKVGLALVVPIVGCEALRFFEMWNCAFGISGMINIFAKTKFSVSH